MGTFERTGTFQDRAKFVEVLKQRVSGMRQGAMAMMKEEWKSEGGSDIGTLAAMGVNVTFRVDPSSWKCTGEVPMWLPIPQSKIEAMIDKQLEALKGI